MTEPTPCHAHLHPAVASRSLVPALLRWLLAAAERQRQRCSLADLDAAALADLGLTRKAALREARRPFWR
jgi:uncharacterized protein YjiS (DUF1127 family)